jgi:hypothetical protein
VSRYDDDDAETGDDLPPPQERYEYRKSGGAFDGAIRTILVSVLTAGILGFVAFVFAMNGTITNLQNTDTAHNGAIANLKLTNEFLQEQIKEVRDEQKVIRGKVYRSDGSLAGDFSADERQPQ